MINPKEGVLNRIEQSVELFKNNFINIFAPLFIFKFITSIIIGNIIYFYGVSFFDFSGLSDSSNISGMLADAFGDTGFIIGVNVVIILILINLILVIPFIIATIRSIKQSYDGEKSLNYIDNIEYGFKNLSNSFRTYWFMFVYVALIPSIIIIVGGLILIFGQLKNLDNILQIGMFIAGFGLILLMFFAIYRGYKTTFSIVSAVDYNSYSQENFDNSVKTTNKNWWRIVGNFILLSLIISFVGGIIGGIIGIFKISTSDFSILGLIDFQNPQISPEIIEKVINGFSKGLIEFSISKFLISILELFVEILFMIFTIIFTYIFYKRLESEDNISVIGDNEITNFEMILEKKN